MSFEETSLSDRSVTVLKNKGEDYLLEVFRPWDCHEQKWADEDTVQLRFEAADLLIGRDPDRNAENRIWEVLTGIEGVHQGSSVGLNGEGICWLVDDSLIEEPGEYGSIEAHVKRVIAALTTG